MNLRRGLFRLWIVGSALFVLALAFVGYTEIKEQFTAVASMSKAEWPVQLAGFRQRYPQYNHLSDAQLMDAFYKKLYSDLTREEFDKRMATAKSAIDPENLAQLEKAVADIRVPHPWATLGTWASIAFFQIHLARVDRTFQLATDREAIAQIATRGTNRRGRQAIVSFGRTGPFGPGESNQSDCGRTRFSPP
jgi:hypothetical protein